MGILKNNISSCYFEDFERNFPRPQRNFLDFLNISKRGFLRIKFWDFLKNLSRLP